MGLPKMGWMPGMPEMADPWVPGVSTMRMANGEESLWSDLRPHCEGVFFMVIYGWLMGGSMGYFSNFHQTNGDICHLVMTVTVRHG